MKLEASSRHSDENFLDVNPVGNGRVGTADPRGKKRMLTHQNRNTATIKDNDHKGRKSVLNQPTR